MRACPVNGTATIGRCCSIIQQSTNVKAAGANISKHSASVPIDFIPASEKTGRSNQATHGPSSSRPSRGTIISTVKYLFGIPKNNNNDSAAA
jgi:hypothetical protein